MQRRTLLAGLLCAGCTPWSITGEEDTRSTTPEHAPSMELLAVAEFSAMFDSTSLALYANGLIDRRFMGEDENYGMNPNPPRRFRMGVASPEQLQAVRTDLASTGFANAEPHYHEEGVMDGGCVVIAGVVAKRRIIVVNEPEVLPAELRRLTASLWELAQYAEKRGRDPFDPATPQPARLLLVHEFWRSDSTASHMLTVFDHGDLELRITSDSSEGAHDQRDYPTPRTQVQRLDDTRLGELRQAVRDLHDASLPLEHRSKSEANVRARHWLTTADGTYYVATGDPVPHALRQVLELGEELATL